MSLLTRSRALALALLGTATLIGCGDEVAGVGPDVIATPDVTIPETSETSETSPETVEPEGLRVTALDPAEGSTSGLQEVHITGGGLLDVVEVLFGDTAALDPFPVSDRLLVVLSPPRARGLVDVTVVTATGERATLPLAYNYADAVQLTAIEPVSGHWLGGERVTVYGSGFTEDAVVLVGGRPALQVAHIDDNTLSAVTPEGLPGKVDVHVSTGEGVGRLQLGYEYVGETLPVSSAEIDAVTPEHGPVAGGTAISLSGSGFKSGAAVRVGALAATDVRVESATRITARTPIGSPGAATIRIIQSGAASELVDGFVYDGPPAVWVVDPPQGAVAGNTRVFVRGHGFPVRAAVDVRFGGNLASDVRVLDDRTIECRTPAGVVGLAAVEVSGGGVTATHPRGYSYFDPATTPGTWGGPIEGNLNVTVQDAQAGTRLAGALVVLGPNVRGAFRGLTDANGQVTFSGDEVAQLTGPQTVTASVTGYQVFQLAGFNAQNVTLPLDRIPVCSDLSDMPCEQVTEPPPVAFLTAHIDGSDKGPTIPFGECRDWRDAPNGLCHACAVDEDCDGVAPDAGGVVGEGGAGVAKAICRELGSEGAFCSFKCTTNAECTGGFVCLDPTGADRDRRCVPPPGEAAVYCDQTETDMFASDMISYPGIRVPASRTLQVGIHLGDFALFCWSGVEVRGDFRPKFLGVTRNLGAYNDGESVETEVSIDIPLTQRVEIEVEKPANGVFGQELTVVRTALNLGGDGVLAFPTRRGFLSDHFVLYVPEALTGELYDATWETYAEVDVAPLNGGSALYDRGLDHLGGDIDYIRDNGAWGPFDAPKMTTRALATWQDGGGVETVVAVGQKGAILKRFGNTWAYMNGATDRELMALAVAPSAEDEPTTNAIAVGQGGVAVHWDGLRWQAQETNTPATLEAVAFGSETVAFAIAGPHIMRWDGTAWTFVHKANANLHGLVALSADELIAVGDGGTVVHGEGASFSETTSGNGNVLRAVVLMAGGSYIAVGDAGTTLRSADGSQWSLETSGIDYDLNAVWTRGDDVWAVGGRGTIMHRDAAGEWSDVSVRTTRGTLRAIAGAGERIFAMGSHELVLGPLLGVPEDLSPAPGGQLTDSLSWTARPGLDPHFSVIESGSQVGPCSACGFLFNIPYTEWRTVLHGDLFEAHFPNFAGIPNTESLGSGSKVLTLYRVRADESFDFDHTATTGFFGGTWRAWSWRTEGFFR